MSITSQALGHGMGTDWEEKDWAHISLSDLEALQIYYPVLRGELQLLWHSPRPFSSAAIIEIRGSGIQYFIKRSHRSFRHAKDLLEEHAFIQHLAAKNLPIVVLVPSTQGETALELGEWTYEVHQKAKGIDLYHAQQSWTPFFYPDHAAKTGEFLAKLHVAAQDFPMQQARLAQYLVCNQALLESENIVEAIHQRINGSAELSSYFSNKTLDLDILNYISELHNSIKTVIQNASKIWTHNDAHASNFLWSAQSIQAEITTIFDFGLANYNSALYDFATTVERNFIDWLQLGNTQDLAIDYDGLTAFIQAYFVHQPVSAEFSVLPTLLQIVHIDFAFSELEYFVGITKNIAHADSAYQDWFIGHINWFRSPQGQQFIRTLTDLMNNISHGSLLRSQHSFQNNKVSL